MSKVKARVEKIISLEDWNEIVQKTYNRPYNLQQQDGCKDRGYFSLTVPCPANDYPNDSIPEIVNHEKMGVSFSAWLARNPKTPFKIQLYSFELELWWERNFYPDIQMVANDLHSRGLLEKGSYKIEIDW